MPERFDLFYTDADDVQQRPVMIHRALLGSMERFAGILIEHYAGRFPVWLAPVQAIMLPVADRHNEHAAAVAGELREAGVRVAIDERSESVGKKIRDAELGRYPYMLVIGDREQEAGTVSVRSHTEGELGAMPQSEFAARIGGESDAGASEDG
jgi:threonyl-tRNA synthetase